MQPVKINEELLKIFKQLKLDWECKSISDVMIRIYGEWLDIEVEEPIDPSTLKTQIEALQEKKEDE